MRTSLFLIFGVSLSLTAPQAQGGPKFRDEDVKTFLKAEYKPLIYIEGSDVTEQPVQFEIGRARHAIFSLDLDLFLLTELTTLKEKLKVRNEIWAELHYYRTRKILSGYAQYQKLEQFDHHRRNLETFIKKDFFTLIRGTHNYYYGMTILVSLNDLGKLITALNQLMNALILLKWSIPEDHYTPIEIEEFFRVIEKKILAAATPLFLLAESSREELPPPVIPKLNSLKERAQRGLSDLPKLVQPEEIRFTIHDLVCCWDCCKACLCGIVDRAMELILVEPIPFLGRP